MSILSVSPLVTTVNTGKMADSVEMPFAMVGGVVGPWNCVAGALGLDDAYWRHLLA